MAESPKFAHRSNPDGTSDSICFRCIATVASVHDERELLRYEQQHICDPALVERFDGTKPPSCGTVEDSQNCNSQILASRNDLAKCELTSANRIPLLLPFQASPKQRVPHTMRLSRHTKFLNPSNVHFAFIP